MKLTKTLLSSCVAVSLLSGLSACGKTEKEKDATAPKDITEKTQSFSNEAPTSNTQQPAATHSETTTTTITTSPATETETQAPTTTETDSSDKNSSDSFNQNDDAVNPQFTPDNQNSEENSSEDND